MSDRIDETSFFFEHRGSSLFGVLHTPVQPAPPRLGIVLCPAFADEAFRTHRELVVLARRLAQAGIAALRFDYRGTGESQGAFEDFGLEDWCADIRRAVDVLQQRTGATCVGLFGLRLGAALAATVAAEDPRIERLILCAPADPAGFAIELGKALRTQQLIQRGSVTERTTIEERLERGEPVEVGGYPLTHRLYRELQSMRPWTGDARPCKGLILGMRGDSTKEPELRAMQRSYAEAELKLLDERRFWFQKVYQAPEQVYEAVISWLTEESAPPPHREAAPPRPSPSPLGELDESPVEFESAGLRLNGILHTPSSQPYGRQGVIIFHGGRQARRGPHRLYVKLARRLCAAGFHVLRYDNRGYGDSEGDEQRIFREWQEDAVCATRFFREHARLEHLWGWGLCAGALLGMRTAAAESAAFDGLVFCNALLDRAPHRDAQPPASEPLWRRAAAAPVRGARRLRRRVKSLLAPPRADGFRRRFDRSMEDPLADFPKLLAELARPALLIFGDIDPHANNYSELLFKHPAWREPPGGAAIDIEVIPGGDHNFIWLEHEEMAIRKTEQWLAARAAAAVAATPRA